MTSNIPSLERTVLQKLANCPSLLKEGKTLCNPYLLERLWPLLRIAQFECSSHIGALLPQFAVLPNLNLSGLASLKPVHLVDYAMDANPHLHQLDMSQWKRIHQMVLWALRRCRHLSTLRCVQSTFRGSGFQRAFEASKAFPALTVLNLRRCADIGTRQVNALRHLDTLRELDLSYTPITSWAIVLICRANYAPGLQRLMLTGTTVKGKYLLKANIATTLPQLELLVLSKMPHLLTRHLAALIRKCTSRLCLVAHTIPNLDASVLTCIQKSACKQIDLGKNRQLDMASVRTIKQKLQPSSKLIGGRVVLTLLFATRALTDARHTLDVDGFDTIATLRTQIDALGVVTRPYRLRHAIYRKNGTRRPGALITDTTKLIYETISFPKRHIYVDTETTSADVTLSTLHDDAIHLIIRRWDVDRNAIVEVGGMTVKASTPVLDFKSVLRARFGVFRDMAEHTMILVEEETPYLFNLMSPGATLCTSGIILGDIIHVEPFNALYYDTARAMQISSLTANYYYHQQHRFRFYEEEISYQRRLSTRTLLRYYPRKIRFTLMVGVYDTCASLLVRIAKCLRLKKHDFAITSRVERNTDLVLARNTRVLNYLKGNLWYLIMVVK